MTARSSAQIQLSSAHVQLAPPGGGPPPPSGPVQTAPPARGQSRVSLRSTPPSEPSAESFPFAPVYNPTTPESPSSSSGSTQVPWRKKRQQTPPSPVQSQPYQQSGYTPDYIKDHTQEQMSHSTFVPAAQEPSRARIRLRTSSPTDSSSAASPFATVFTPKEPESPGSQAPWRKQPPKSEEIQLSTRHAHVPPAQEMMYRAQAQDAQRKLAAMNLPEEVVEKYRRRFDLMDLNKDGVVSMREMAAVGKVFGYRLTSEELQEIFGKRDLDMSGALTFDEFIVAMIQRAQTKKKPEPIREYFKEYDVRKRGYITSDEAYPILARELGFDENKTESFVDRFDKNKDYRISLTEFVDFHQKVQELRDQLRTAFQQWDQNNDGYVDFAEARAVMAPKAFSDEEIWELIDKYDADQDGRLSYSEFAAFWDIPID